MVRPWATRRFPDTRNQGSNCLQLGANKLIISPKSTGPPRGGAIKSLTVLSGALLLASPSVFSQDRLRAQAVASNDSLTVAQGESAAETELMLSQFERSYVTTTDLRGKEPKLIFEGSVAPPLYVVSTGKNLAIVAVPKVVLRMFLERSVPVKTPSYMPRVTVYRFINPEQSVIQHAVASYVSLTVSHHSNGQAGPFRNPDGTVNHESGNFSTNFVEVAYVRGGPVAPGVEGQSRFSVEFHPPGWYDRESNVGYSHLRLHLSATSVETTKHNPSEKCSSWRCFRDVTFNYAITYLSGNVPPNFRGRGRFPLWIELSSVPAFSPDLSVFLNGYWGQDYYNTYFTQKLSTIRLGIQGRRGSDRSSVQPRGT
jgi:hypothetical protein